MIITLHEKSGGRRRKFVRPSFVFEFGTLRRHKVNFVIWSSFLCISIDCSLFNWRAVSQWMQMIQILTKEAGSFFFFFHSHWASYFARREPLVPRESFSFIWNLFEELREGTKNEKIALRQEKRGESNKNKRMDNCLKMKQFSDNHRWNIGMNDNNKTNVA